MKKILLMIGVGFLFFNNISAKAAPYSVGSHFAMSIAGGVSPLTLSVKGSVIKNDQTELKDGIDLIKYLPSVHLNMGYSYCFSNNLTLGVDARLGMLNITPGLSLGCALNNKHWIGICGHYNILLGKYYENFLTAEHKAIVKNTLDINPWSGVGLSVIYQYHFDSKAFFQLEGRCDYYTGKLKESFAIPEDVSKILGIQKISGEFTLWDITCAVSLGYQW